MDNVLYQSSISKAFKLASVYELITCTCTYSTVQLQVHLQFIQYKYNTTDTIIQCTLYTLDVLTRHFLSGAVDMYTCTLLELMSYNVPGAVTSKLLRLIPFYQCLAHPPSLPETCP